MPVYENVLINQNISHELFLQENEVLTTHKPESIHKYLLIPTMCKVLPAKHYLVFHKLLIWQGHSPSSILPTLSYDSVPPGNEGGDNENHFPGDTTAWLDPCLTSPLKTICVHRNNSVLGAVETNNPSCFLYDNN